MYKKIKTTRIILLVLGLLISFTLVVVPIVATSQPIGLKLNEGEVLFVHLTTNQHFEWEHDEINWYKVEQNYHLVVDIKNDPTTAYFPFENIATWGVER